MDARTRVADYFVPSAWIGWLVSHITEINSILQTILLVTSIIATLIAARYHWRAANAKNIQPK
jgi:hypothetical protein